MTQFSITPLNTTLKDALTHKINYKTKPQGALGQLEAIALQVGLIQQTLTPQLKQPTMLVFAGDHGITQSGVSPYPQAVTAQMVLNFLAGGAAINVFSRQVGMQLRVIDAGVNHVFASDTCLIDAKIGMGTANFLEYPAMTLAQCDVAMTRGAELARSEIAAGCNIMGFGEMGIGNTSSASCLMSVLTGIPITQCVGRGTGLDDAGLANKIHVLTQAIQHHALQTTEAHIVLSTFGGFEIAMMVGAMLGAAEQEIVLLIDGFIATAALLVASKLEPAVLDYCIFAHRSDEHAHKALLDYLGATPLLDIGLRLGEGTGAVLAYPLVQSAVNFLNEMASFESAGVSERELS
ncbi:nicotinate-nucleotide--dimethylbenzimidazole phosphoribosyltransferase [Methylotenera sp. 1P/1]|uniref:nicotinate-nucleotide--dimethylbenzimidazole phosphoribosyltransferase n=1 Tax=Methylotenera sp. 1P/1 TaxID=1131551 RepID=UPI000361390B|nr:nicotinate-nucleotide--dimethylbenzimidazole phosphoribosyltransferase [Methylotenera sp. 1P/1]